MHRIVPALFFVAISACVGLPAQEALWIEGESPSASGWNQHGWYTGTGLRLDLMSPGVPSAAQGAVHGHWTNGDPTDTAQATWSFDVTEGGDYDLWIRLNPTWARYRISIDAGPLIDLPTEDHRELVNIVDGIDVRWLAWVRAGSHAWPPGTHTVTLEVAYDARRNATHGMVDALCAVNFPWEPMGTIPPGSAIEPAGPAVWFPLRAGNDPLAPDSVTDLRDLWHRPAGIHGPLQRVDDGLAFRDLPGERMQLWGVNVGSVPATEDLMRRQAQLLAKHGVTLVRFHPVEAWLGVLQDDGSGGRILDPAALDAFDLYMAILKEEGLYWDWSLFYPHVLTPADGYDPALYAELDDQGSGKSSAGLVTVFPAMQDAEWEWARRLLEHVNPYTGLGYAVDPALAIVETRNEDSVFWHFPLNDLAAGSRWPLHTDEVQRRWMQWLQSRYGDDAGLASAWGPGMRPGDSVSNPDMGIYGAWQMAAEGPDLGAGVVPDERARLGDFIRFLAEAQRAGYQRRRDRLRALGYAGLFVTTAWRAGGPSAQAANLWTDEAGDAIDRHAYAGGGVGNWYVAPGAVNTASHLPVPGRRIVGGHVYDSSGEEVVLYAWEGKPVILSEWSQSPPNPWKAEAAPLVAYLGMGLQGWDAVVHFAASRPRMGSGWPWNARGPSSFVTETPHYLGQFPALIRAVREGHLLEGEVTAARRIATDELFAGFDVLSQDLATGGFPGANHLRVAPEMAVAGRVLVQAGEGLPPSERLDEALYWDPAGGTADSTTSQSLWDYADERVVIRSPRTQALIGRAQGAGPVDLGDVRVEVRTPFVSLLFTSLDGLPMADSERILVTALARDRQWGATYSADGSQLLEVGGPPLRLEPVQATLEIGGRPLASAQVLDIHGVPTGREAERSGNTVVIDGRFETYLYLLTREPAVGETCLHRTRASTRDPMTPAADLLFLAAPGANGVSLDAGAPGAEVPYLCPFASGDIDPAPPATPLVFWQVDGELRLRLQRDPASGAISFLY